MKARVKETGEIIDVQMLYPVTYSRLDGNHKIIEEYDEDELELIIPPRPKMVSLDKACEWLERNTPYGVVSHESVWNMVREFRKTMEE